MAAKKKNIISKASPHTIKKFELIEEYIKSWAQKLLLTESCNGLIFIDCMCNSGVYTDDAGQLVKGTAVRVSEALREASGSYTEKNIHIYLNDKDKARVDELKKHLPQDERNFKIVTSCGDAHELLRTIGPQLYGTGHLHYFLLYDPYDATIDWEALLPFFRNWGEVMINHMVSDPVRAITSAKKKTTKAKYENTYLEDFEKLVPYGSEKKDYEDRVKKLPSRYGCPFRVGVIEENNKVMMYLLMVNNEGKLNDSIPSVLITNIFNYLSMYRSLNDYVEIKSGRIINVSIEVDAYIDKNYNVKDVVNNMIQAIKQYMDINKHTLGEDIYVGDLQKEIGKVDGVLNIMDMRVFNETGQDYSQTKISQQIKEDEDGEPTESYEVDLYASDYILNSESDEMFEIKYPDKDIRIKVKAR